MRIPKTFTVEESLLADLERSRGNRSTSERVNELLKRALEHEAKENLEREAALFYSENANDRAERRAFQKASIRSLERD
ncbi:hypothetical protein SBA1_1190003 [Candidatus Sulfotelmatobacter kueseliae]|jgi:hypothetical protein|uniref:Uncharacterized protein n=1 Tax=Candidatus Sulfotelmatobacter kueseliae TaxID=2042962 RepID=A0A2U3K1D7_9BACT|nr:hypothetical protein SBA1_1190003 [Candidatus Sulfotelmatobacter kueseliae]